MGTFHFDGQWHIDAAPERVFAALADADAYPQWWPQVTAARRIDDSSGEIRSRSRLPVDLVYVVHRELVDPAAGVLRARFDGDLAGTGTWTVRPDGPGAVATFDQQFSLTARILRTAGMLARPAVRADHQHMMRSGERGLRRHLATADSVA